MKDYNSKQLKNRRSFLRGSLAAGAAATSVRALSEGELFAGPNGIPPTPEDGAILRLLGADEPTEADLCQQYAELGGLTPGQEPVERDTSFVPMNSYQAAFMNPDSDGPQC